MAGGAGLLETGRVALIRYVSPEGEACAGSGLLVNGRQVLTAGHVADGSGHQVECGRGTRLVVAVLRSGTPEVDLAVLTLGEDVAGFGQLGCALVDREQVGLVEGCVAVGFPRWRKSGSQRRSAQVDGRVPTAEGLESTADAGLRAGWLTLVGDRIPGAPEIPVGTLTETAPSLWGGMSGAVVVAGDLVIGVVRSHNLAAGGQSLTVTPLSAVDQLPGEIARQFWDAVGVADPARLPLLPGPAAWPVRVTELRGQGHLLDFTGRADELARLQALLAGGDAAPVVLHGLGGVGKSQLAVEYAHARRAELAVVWTARGDDASVLAADLAALGVVTGAADPAEADIEVQLAGARGWLASNRGWLLIIDNVDDPAVLPAVHRLLPSGGTGQVIITSQISAWPGRYHRVEVTALDTGPAARLLLSGAADTDEQAAKDLAGALGGLPLALQQAAGYCQQNGRTLASYLTLFRDAQRQARLLAAGPEGQETVAVTWAVSIERVRHSDPAAAALLAVLAYLAPDAIPRALLAAEPAETAPVWPASVDGATAGPLASLHDLDELAADQALGVLHRYSLIQLTPHAIAVHRLVQAVIRASHDQQTQHAFAAAAASLVWQALPDLDHDSWPAYEALLPHALAAGSHAASAAGSQDLGVDLLTLAGSYQRERGLFAGARQTHQLALTITERAFTADHERIIDALDILAVTLIEAGDPAAARPYAERALRIAEREYGTDHPQALPPASNLGEILRQLGDPAAARPYAERALRIAEREYGTDHPQALLPASNLGLILYQLGDPAAARPYAERALRIAEREYGTDHPQALLPASNLGLILYQLGDPAAARPYAERALRIAEREYGPADQRVAVYLHRLADIMRSVEPITSMVTLLERAIEIDEQHTGLASPEVIAGLRRLSEALSEAGRLPEAIIPLERVLAADAANVGELAVTLIPTLTSLTDALLASGDQTGALHYLQRLVAVSEHAWAANDLRQVDALRKLAQVMTVCNRGSEVIPVLEKLTALHDYYGNETAEAMNDIRSLAAALLQQKRPHDAQRYAEQAQDIERRHAM